MVSRGGRESMAAAFINAVILHSAFINEQYIYYIYSILWGNYIMCAHGLV